MYWSNRLMAAAVSTVHGASPASPRDLTLSGLELIGLDGEAISGSQLAGKVLLFVNVASRCGFTPQYEGLQALHEARKDAGLVIVGVPCNQFGWQEPGAADEIQSFCKITYDVDFPLLQKQDVNGTDRSPLYQFLVDSDAGAGKPVLWNFEKFLVGRDGQVVGRFRSATRPDDPALLDAIDTALVPSPSRS